MNPMKNVTDPHNIKANEIPNISDANPAGVMCATDDGNIDEVDLLLLPGTNVVDVVVLVPT